MHCISRNLHTLFICVCFFCRTFLFIFSFFVRRYVCAWKWTRGVCEIWALMDHHFGISKMRNTRISLRLCGNHFFLYYKCDTVVWFLPPLHIPNRTKDKVVILLCCLSFRKCEKVRANKIEWEIGAIFSQQLIFCTCWAPGAFLKFC